MDQTDLLGLVRDIMKVGGAILMAHGFISAGDWELYTGLAVTIAPVIWSQVQRMQFKTAIVKAAATGVPAQPGVAAPTSPEVKP